MKNSTFLQNLQQEINKQNLIIAEGKKDFNSLKLIGFNEDKIILLNSGGSFFEKIEKVNNQLEKQKNIKLTILTDNDKKGKILFNKIKKEILNKKAIDDNLNKILLKEKISHIEGVYSYIKNIQEKS